MTQLNFHDMLCMVFCWAAAVRDHLEFQAKHGKPPLYPDLVCPFIELYKVVGMTLGFADSQWPTGVPGSKLHNDLFAMLRPISHGMRNATIADLTRIIEHANSILSGKALEAKEPRSAWQCPNGNIKVPDRLKEPLGAYLAGLPDYDLKDHHQPRKVKTDLKKLIQKACDAGYQPDPDRWPRSEELDGGGAMLYFDDEEDGNRRNQGKG